MSDPTMTLTVHACPPEQVYPLLQAAEDHGMRHGWMHNYPLDARAGVLTLGGPLVHPNGGDAEGLARDLAVAAPGAAWEVYAEPHEGEMGRGAIHVPGAGSTSFPCDGAGTPFYARWDVVRAVATGDAEGLLGIDVFAALDRVQIAVGRLSAKERQVHALRCPGGCGDVEHCPFQCEADDPLCTRRACESHEECVREAALMDAAHVLNDNPRAVAALAAAP